MTPGMRRIAHDWTLRFADMSAVIVAGAVSFVLSRRIGLDIEGEYVEFAKVLPDRLPVLLPVLVVGGLWMQGRGHHDERIPFWSEARDLLGFVFMGVLAEVSLRYAVKEQVSRLWIVSSWVMFPFVCLALRSWMKWALDVLGVRQVGVHVFCDHGGHIARAISSERLLGYRVVGSTVSCDGMDPVAEVRRSGAGLAVIGMSDADTRATVLAAGLSAAGIRFAFCPPIGGLGMASMRPLVLFGHDAVLLVERPGLSAPLARALKRSFDVVGAFLGLVVSAPVVLLAAAVVAAEGGAPFFSHARVGRNGRPIHVWKIRTMCVDAERRLRDLLDSDPVAAARWAEHRKLPDDPRTTAFGRFLRKSTVDEIPQLWNVLVGDMSLVGPRPVVQDEMGRYGEAAALYLGVRPGLTGLWQVSGRSDTGYDRRVELDTWYVRNWSLWIDTVVLLKTVVALLSRRGAY